ncbi:YfhD family protein [Siminovitchia acidinfaciens]|uniref:YfhD family protein n=1 Tax=Siminovitchia acidinfaciens TaxID=2321395 RepID=A0A429XVM2_9BACI|nr:YfhD family protein [Siminovitchia acidinfaciens]RST72312.1 YfhD family protein [Siminovitchia acidinfaciens]
MGRSQNQKARDKNKQKLPQVPKQLKSDGRDIEFSKELADQDDLEALARSEAADKRAKQK